MIIPIDMTGSVGVIRDLPAHELPPNVWSDGRNVRMFEGYLEKSKGYADAFSADPGVAPRNVFPYKVGENMFWVYPNLTSIRVHDGASEFNITKVAATYGATEEAGWSISDFGGVLVLNNGVDVPQVWDGVTSNPCIDLANWPSGYKAEVLRAFGNFLVAGAIDKSGTEYPHLVLWSDAAESGAVPSSWDVTDTTKFAGEKQLKARGGRIIDFGKIRNFNVVYKEGAFISQTFIGGVLVFAWDTITNEQGIFTKHAVRPFHDQQGQEQAFVLGSDDIVIHDGRNVQSVIDERMRRWLYTNIDTDYYRRSFVAADYKRKEMWICFPESGNTWPNLALVWDWKTGAFAVEEIPSLSSMDYGFYDPNAASLKYSDLSTNPYSSSPLQYAAGAFNPSEKSLLAGSYSRTKLYEVNTGNTFDGASITSYVERLGWGYVLDRYGKPVPNTERYKLVRELYPHVTGTGTLKIRVGAQDKPEGPVRWGPEEDFVIGTDKKVNVWYGGNLLAFRITAVGSTYWRLSGMDVDLADTGSHW